MVSVKEALRDTIEALTEDEARRILEFTLQLRGNGSATLRRLASDPTFKVPARRQRAFRAVKPAPGKGVPASRLLIGDRR